MSGFPRPRGDRPPVHTAIVHAGKERFPRPRGDRPSARAVRGESTRARFPRPRGDRPRWLIFESDAVLGSPAHAGIDRSRDKMT